MVSQSPSSRYICRNRITEWVKIFPPPKNKAALSSTSCAESDGLIQINKLVGHLATLGP